MMDGLVEAFWMFVFVLLCIGIGIGYLIARFV